MDFLNWIIGAVIMLCAWFVIDSKENQGLGYFLLFLGAIIIGIMFT